jgi:hypothetical protein
MAASYVTAGSGQTVRVLSQTGVVPVEAIGMYTKPSNIYVVVQVPLSAFQAGNYETYLKTTAALVEGVLALTDNTGDKTNAAGNPMVQGASYIQDIDASGLLSAFMAFTVGYIPTSGYQGEFSEIVTLPMTTFETAAAFDATVNGKTPLAWIEDAYTRQKNLAGL